MVIIEAEAISGLDPGLTSIVVVDSRTGAQQLAMAPFMDIAPSSELDHEDLGNLVEEKRTRMPTTRQGMIRLAVQDSRGSRKRNAKLLEIPSSQDYESGAQVESEEVDFYREVAKTHQPGSRPQWLEDTGVDFEPDVGREEIKERLRDERDKDLTLSSYRRIIGW